MHAVNFRATVYNGSYTEGVAALPYIDFGKNNHARKAYYTGAQGIELVRGWRRQGLALDKIARDKIGIAYETLKKWRMETPALDEALLQSDEYADMAVEGSLLRRAVGYTYDEETWVADPDTGQMVLAKVVKKHVPADTRAQGMWLYNRKPDTWQSQPQAPADDQDIIDVSNVLVQIEEVADGGAPDA